LRRFFIKLAKVAVIHLASVRSSLHLGYEISLASTLVCIPAIIQEDRGMTIKQVFTSNCNRKNNFIYTHVCLWRMAYTYFYLPVLSWRYSAK